MKAVILAGGLGTRLRPLTYTMPKPMLPVVNKPILSHIVSRLSNAGIESAIVTTNYLAKQIDEHIKKADYPIPIEVIEENKPLGTSGSVRNARWRLDGDFLVIQGDTISNLDLKEHIEAHYRKKRIATISLVKVDNPSSFGIAELEKNGKIKKFLEKPAPGQCFSNLANTGTYVFSHEILDAIPEGKSDFSFDVFPELLEKKKAIYGFAQDGYWKDVGSIGNYFAGNRYLLSGLTQGIVGEKAFVSRNAKIIPPSIVGSGAQIGADVTVGPNAIVGNNCQVGSSTVIAGAILHDSVKIGSRCKIESAIVGDKCELGDEVFIAGRAVIGSGCIIERKASIASGSIVGPMVKVQASTQVSGVLSPNVEKIEKVSSVLDKIPVFKKLERDELQVCMTLVEFGELGKEALGKVSKIPKEQLDRSLTHLEKLGIINGKEDSFFMQYEDPERIGEWFRRSKL
ncbi:MAG: NDP-sugar synthase [Candidatus Micrarchaeota archaeon]